MTVRCYCLATHKIDLIVYSKDKKKIAFEQLDTKEIIDILDFGRHESTERRC